MELILDGNGQSESIKLNHNADNFKVSVVAIVSADFEGKWRIEYSPNGTDWIHHESANDITVSQPANIFFQVPYIRFVTYDMTAGSVKFYTYGSLE